MLWFSIPMVVLLAAIPLLIIVSQTEDFNVRKYFNMYNLVEVYQFLVVAYFAFNKPFSGMFWGTLLIAVGTIWLLEDCKRMDAGE